MGRMLTLGLEDGIGAATPHPKDALHLLLRFSPVTGVAVERVRFTDFAIGSSEWTSMAALRTISRQRCEVLAACGAIPFIATRSGTGQIFSSTLEPN